MKKPFLFTTVGKPWKPGDNGGRDARPPGAPGERAPRWYWGEHLPHFDQPEAVQSITIRLFDSLPQERLAELERDAERLDDVTRRKQIEAWLDAGYGDCFLSQPKVGAVVEGAFQFFHGQRYWLHAWVLMPNHAHVLIELMAEPTLKDVLHSWKSYTSHAANKVLQRRGSFWQEDYWDRYIRNQRHFNKRWTTFTRIP